MMPFMIIIHTRKQLISYATMDGKIHLGKHLRDDDGLSKPSYGNPKDKKNKSKFVISNR